MAGESAVQRTPIEIWTVILQQALDSPILPFLDDSDSHLGTDTLKNIRLFPYECTVYQEIVTMKKAAKILRLVCRTWASILINIRHRCIFANGGGISYPVINRGAPQGVERVQIVSNDIGPCSCFRKQVSPCLASSKPHFIFPQQFNWLKNLEDAVLKRLLGQARILSLGDDWIDTKRLIGFMPNLQALSLILPGCYIYQDRPLAILSNISFLTHLHLQRLTWVDFCNGFAAHHPSLRSLRYLDLGFLDEGESMNRPRTEWRLPNLKNLVIRGAIQTKFTEDVDSFLRQCGKTVTEFINVCRYYNPSDYLILDNFSPYRRFPHLTLYGTWVSSIVKALHSTPQDRPTSSSGGSIPRTLLLYELRDCQALDPEDCAMWIIAYANFWGFENIVIRDSWIEISRFDMDSLWLSRFSDTIARTSVKFSDIDGIDVREPQCRALW